VNRAVEQAEAAGAARRASLERRGAQSDPLTPVQHMPTDPEATSPFAAARDELESLTRGAASLFEEAERDLEESATRVAELEAMVEDKDAEVRKLKQVLLEKDTAIRKKNEQLEQKDQRLAQLSSALQALTHDELS